MGVDFDRCWSVFRAKNPSAQHLIHFLQRIFICVGIVCGIVAAPRTPSDANEVLEQLPRRFGATPKRVAGDQENIRQATARARSYIAAWRREADPRYLGYGEAALKRWWSATNVPVETLVARATIKQSLHQFEAALEDLEYATRVDQDHAQAWFLRATILQVQGRFAEARETCVHLLRCAPHHIAIATVAAVASLTGRAEESYQALKALARRLDGVSDDEKVWLLTLLAEMAERLGWNQAARQHFQQALLIAPRDWYLLGAYADFLTRQGEATHAYELVRSQGPNDALLLRRALALQAMGKHPEEFAADVRELERRFAASRLRGDETHAREESLFELMLGKGGRHALELALRNWETQREPLDALLVLKAARAAGDAAAAQHILRWMEMTGIQDVRLKSAAESLQ